MRAGATPAGLMQPKLLFLTFLTLFRWIIKSLRELVIWFSRVAIDFNFLPLKYWLGELAECVGVGGDCVKPPRKNFLWPTKKFKTLCEITFIIYGLDVSLCVCVRLSSHTHVSRIRELFPCVLRCSFYFRGWKSHGKGAKNVNLLSLMAAKKIIS